VAEEVAKIRREKELAEIGPKPTSLERMHGQQADPWHPIFKIGNPFSV